MVFPIGFDLEGGIKEAERQAEAMQERIKKAVSGKPIEIKPIVDEEDAVNSISAISEEMKKLSKEWNKMSFIEKQGADKTFSEEAQKKILRFKKLSASLEVYGLTLEKIIALENKAAEDEKKLLRGIYAGKIEDGYNEPIERRIKKLNEIESKINEIDARFSRMNFSGKAYKEDGSTSERAAKLLHERNRLEEERTRILITGEDAAKRFRKEEAEDLKRIAREKEEASRKGYIETQKQIESVGQLRKQYESVLSQLEKAKQQRISVRVEIDKMFEPELNKINQQIAQLRKNNLQLGGKGDVKAIQSNLAAIKQLESEIQRINNKKVSWLNFDSTTKELNNLKANANKIFSSLQDAERRLAADTSLNRALDAQSKKILQIQGNIQKLDQQWSQLNANGKAYGDDGTLSERAVTILNQRIDLTRQLEQASKTSKQAQVDMERQLQDAEKKTAMQERQRIKEQEAENKRLMDLSRRRLKEELDTERNRERAIQVRSAELRKERKMLSAQENTLGKINDKLAVYNKLLRDTEIGSEKFKRITEQIQRLSDKMKDVSGEREKEKAANRVTDAYKRQSTYIERLIKRMFVYGSIRMVGNFLKNVREVTAQFELQRKSLGAIIQDQTRANALFSEIKQFALKSPVSIMDFTKYTKQVAAYGIETEKLFDTTKRLADVSVGLGVSLDRLALFYGQVYATGYLRASEVRQATEAGIPLVAKLADKLSEANGELVTAKDVMDMISKRAISFDMVAEVFEDMTNKGGMFYNMQEKQGNTLYGMWAKLGDAASMMYEEIGNTGVVRKGMESTIKLITYLMKNWRSLSRIVIGGGAAIGVYTVFVKKLKREYDVVTAATDKYTRAANRKAAADAKGGKWMQFNANMAARAAKANIKAASATHLFTRAVRKLQAAFLSNWLTAILAALGLIIERIITATRKANALKNALKEIEKENRTEQEKSVRNFNSLANLAVNSADGSKKQRDALEELKRTYGDIIPVEQLSIDNLRQMRGDYDNLTKSVRQYIQEQMKQKARDKVVENFGDKMLKQERKVTAYLEKMGLSYERAQAFMEEYRKAVESGSEDMEKNVTDAFKAIGVELEKEGADFQEMASRLYSIYETDFGGFIHEDKIKKLTKLYKELNQELKELETRNGLNNAGDDLGKYKKYVEDLTKTVEKATYKTSSGNAIENMNSYLAKQMRNNLAIKTMGKQLKEALGDAWDDSFATVVERINAGQANVISSLDFAKIIEAAKAKGDPALENLVKDYQERYKGIVPSDSVVRTLRDKLYELSKTFKDGMNKMQKFTLQEGKDLKEHLKFVTDYAEELEAQIYKLRQQAKLMLLPESFFGLPDKDAELDAVKKYAEAIKYYLKDDKKDKGSDPRLQTLKDIADKMAQINKEYREQLKYQDEQAAFATTQALFAKSFKEMQKAADKYGFKLPTFETPKTAKDVEKWYRAIMDEIKRLNLKDSAKVLIDLGFNAGKVNIDDIQRNIEEQLSRMADEIAKSKTVKNFFDKIFADTKDYDLAMDVTVGVYGDTGGDLKRKIAEQIRYATSKQGGDNFVDVADFLDMGGIIDPKTLDVNYKALRDAIKKYEETGKKIPEEQKKVLNKILENGEEYSKAQIERWNEVLNKNRTFAQQYVDLWREVDDNTREIRAKVARGEMSKETGDAYIQGYQRKRSEGEAKLELEQFKEMPMYVQMFDDLDKASGKALKNMRDKLAALQSMWGSSLSPTELKELQSRLNEIDAQLATKNPFKLLSDSIREYKDARDSLQEEPAELRVKNAKAKVGVAEKDYGVDSYQAAQAREELAVEEKRLAIVKQVNENKKATWGYERQIAEAVALSETQQAEARANLEAAQEEYRKMQEEAAQSDQTNATEVDAWNAKLAAQNAVVKSAEKEYTLAQNTVKSFQKQANAAKKLKSNIDKVFQVASKWASSADSIAGTLGDIKDLLQISSDSAAGIVFDSAVEGLQNFSKIMGVIIGLQTIYNAICKSNPWLAIAAAILAVISIVSSLIQNDKIAKQNAKIEEQDKIIKRLEREYDRLSDMQEKVFGAEYIANYTKRLDNLSAHYEAIQKRIEAEKEKGKKADKDKIEEWEDEAYDTMKKIEDMQDEVSERMMGTSLESAAVSFAESWLDAYLSFSDTAEAMKDKYKEMMRSFIVQNILAKSVSAMLAPVYKMIDEAAADKKITEDEMAEIADLFSQVYKGMDGSLTALMDMLMEKIPELKDLYDTGELTGISRDIATASEESINGLAVGINTQNFYISRIHANMNLLMESLNTGALKFTLADATLEALDKHLAYLPTIAQHTAETVNRCERAAVACENTLELLGKVIKPDGATAAYKVHIA